ncbi:hypothetical protein [Desulfohalovibrio reitneri]|uniref:hypothetical protein n=1 Tax=Desulfohalovibrio reitneri TaxID=1307759 RepID=UPI00110EE53F|nr:hypothetical protein [Desulfohalovibrio reitneri]
MSPQTDPARDTRIHTAVKRLPPRVRLALGWLLLLLGVPLYILPIPLGLAFIVPGVYLLCGASPALGRRFATLRRSLPRLGGKRGTARGGRRRKSAGLHP